MVWDEGRVAHGDLAGPVMAVQRRAWLAAQLVVEVLQRVGVLEFSIVEIEILTLHLFKVNSLRMSQLLFFFYFNKSQTDVRQKAHRFPFH